MSVQKKQQIKVHRREQRVRSKLKENIVLPRVTVFRSLKGIYAQLIDDNKHATLASCSSHDMKHMKGDKKAIAHAVGLELAKKAKSAGVSAVRFDRGRYLYHGRVEALSQGLRDGGLQV